MKPTFVLQVFNPELYKAQNNEPMPILLTRSEYWELAEVDGLDPSFCNLDTETTSDKVGNQNITTTYDGRNVSFTVSLFTPHIDDSLEFFSRYLVTGVYAILRIVEKPGLYLKCKIANYEFNRWTNGADVTINLQVMDRFWHFDNTEAEEGNGFYVVSDVETKPYIKTGAVVIDSGYTLTYATLTVTHEVLSIPSYEMTPITTTKTKYLTIDLSSVSITGETVVYLIFDSETHTAYVQQSSLTPVDVTSYIQVGNLSYEIWDWLLQPGFNTVSLKVTERSSTTTKTKTQKGITVQTRPKFVTYPKGLTNSKTFSLSPYLVPENIAVGVTILGVTGTYAGGRDTYTGETTVTPSNVVQTLPTGGYMLDKNITVRAISPVLDGATIENEVTTTDPTEGHYTNMIYISKKTQKAYLRGYLNKSGWYNAMYSLAVMGFAISEAEQAKIIPENIAEGVTILGVTGTLKKSVKFGTVESSDWGGADTYFPGYIQTINIDTPITPPSNASRLFSGLEQLTTCNCNMLNTENVTNMYYMFTGSFRLVTLDISNFNTAKVIDMRSMFYGCTALTTVTWGPNWASNTQITAFDVSSCPLSHDSCLDLLNKLATRTNSPTLTLSATTKGYMSDEELAIATGKGWTIA